MILINRNLHLFHYGVRSIAFIIFVFVTLFYVPLYTATLPPLLSSSSLLMSKKNRKNNMNDHTNIKKQVETETRKRTLGISFSMRVCFEILAPSSEIGLHPPALVMSMCKTRIPPELLVTGDNYDYFRQNNDEHDNIDQDGSDDRSNARNDDDENQQQQPQQPMPSSYTLQPEDRPYVQKVLRHFSSIVVLHDVAYTLYDSTVSQLEKQHQARVVAYEKMMMSTSEENDKEDDKKLISSGESNTNSSSSSSQKVTSNNKNNSNKKMRKINFFRAATQNMFSLVDFWLSDFPVAVFWAFMTNTNQFLKVIEAVNWLRLLPSLTFLSPQVRGGMLTFYLLCLCTGGEHPCSIFEISFAFHFCAIVALIEWIAAVSDRLVIIQPQTQTQPQTDNNTNNNNTTTVANNNDSNTENTNNENTNDEDREHHHQDRNDDGSSNDLITTATPSYFSSINLFASQYNRKVLLQELFGYLVLQVFIPPCVAGFVLSGLVALAVIVVN